jgi:recombination protein RecA
LVKIVKNKLTATFKEAGFDIMFTEGVSEVEDLIDLAVTPEVINK